MQVVDEEEMMTCEDVAQYLKVSSAWVRESCRRNALPHHKIGRQYRFLKHEIRESITRSSC